MPTCGTYSAPPMPAMTAESTQTTQLVGFRAVAEEAGAAFGVAHGDQHYLPKREATTKRAT